MLWKYLTISVHVKEGDSNLVEIIDPVGLIASAISEETPPTRPYVYVKTHMDRKSTPHY